MTQTTNAAPGKTAAKTEYVVLAKNSTDQWTEIRTVPAANAEAAIRSVAEGQTPPPSTYVAVPARSWKPVTVKTETRTVVTLENA